VLGPHVATHTITYTITNATDTDANINTTDTTNIASYPDPNATSTS
jgi:hypothetical protein